MRLPIQIEYTAQRNTAFQPLYVLGKPDKMLILNLIRFKVYTKLIIFFTKYIRKYRKMIINEHCKFLNDFLKRFNKHNVFLKV